MARVKSRDWWNLFAMLGLVLQVGIPMGDMALALVGKIALAVPYVAWLWVRGRKRMGRFELLLLSALTAAFVLLPVLWRGRVLLLCYMGLFVLLLALWGTLVWLHREEEKRVELDMTLAIVMFLNLVAAATRYTFVSSLPFGVLSLILGGVLALVVCLLWCDRKQKLVARIGVFLILALVLSFFSFSCLANLNYALDESEPQVLVATIEDKRRGGGRRHRYRYFAFDLDGERIRLDVSNNEYNRYDIGDEYILVYYEGAFDEPYFLPGGGA